MTAHPWAMARRIEAAGDRSRTQLQVSVEMPAEPTMQAIVVRSFGGPEALRLETCPLPEPKPGEVRIAIARAGVAFGDTLRRQGLAGVSRPPFTPGYDVAGRIAALGPGVANWSIGDRVVAYTEYGGYAEAVCAPAEGLARIPDRLDDTTAVALVLNYGTAFQMLRHVAQAEPGNAIVVTGAAGGVGTAVLDIARALGVTAVGLASVAKHDIVRSFGAAPVDDRSPDVVARVRDALGGRGANAVFDGIGGGHLWRSRAMADRRGLIVLFGVAGSVERGRKRMLGLAPTVVALAGMRLLPGPRVRLYASAAEQGKRRSRYGADVAELLAMAADGRLKPLIHKEISLGEAVQAHRELEHGSVVGKIVITPSH